MWFLTSTSASSVFCFSIASIISICSFRITSYNVCYTKLLRSSELELQFISHIDKLFDKIDFQAIIFEDYDKGNITPAIIEHVVAKAKQRNIPTLVDPKKRNFNAYKGVTLFKPNFKEICEGLRNNFV